MAEPTIRLVNVRSQIEVEAETVTLSNLTSADTGRLVVHTAPHGDHELGKVKSWNDYFVFVRFHLGDTSAACYPDQLRWVATPEE